MKDTTQFLLRLDKKMHKKIKRATVTKGISMNQWLVDAAYEKYYEVKS